MNRLGPKLYVELQVGIQPLYAAVYINDQGIVHSIDTAVFTVWSLDESLVGKLCPTKFREFRHTPKTGLGGYLLMLPLTHKRLCLDRQFYRWN